MEKHGVTRAVVGLLVLFLAAGGCEGAGGEPTLSPGRYLYTASHPVPSGEDSIRLNGVMEITGAGAEGVEGRWDVPQLHPELESLGAGGSDLVVTAHPTYFGTILHRLRPGGDGEVACEGEYTWVAEEGEHRSLPLTCTLDPDVPEGYDPALPNPQTRIIRPLDADTLPPVRDSARP